MSEVDVTFVSDGADALHDRLLQAIEAHFADDPNGVEGVTVVEACVHIIGTFTAMVPEEYRQTFLMTTLAKITATAREAAERGVPVAELVEDGPASTIN